MDGNPPDELDACALPKTKPQGWPAVALEQDNKKTLFWMGGVMECFSTVLSLFSKADTNPSKDNWEVPFAELSEFLYLGAGAQGIVFRSRLRGEFVAVKKLREKSETNIKHLRKLDHSNIVRFKGVSTNGPIPCIIMEYCQHGPLFEYLHRGVSISVTQTFEWARDIALGMAYLHSNKIIHRDLKSPNILIADNFRVKVSDFGTSREWDDVSAIMSFTGTVAWMAPEVIRHEPCSERVDVWSYGVVLWELLTQEIPYKSLETHAIMWGVGTDTLSLPVPTSCPESMQSLLRLCWNRIPRRRPHFKTIAAHLEITVSQCALLEHDQDDSFDMTQRAWRKEIKDGIKFITRARPQCEMLAPPPPPDLVITRKRASKSDVRQDYEQQLNRANELYMEVCAVRLQLEQREKDVTERENALKACRCGIRKNLKFLQRQSCSTSSDSVRPAAEQGGGCRNKDETPTQVVVNFLEKNEKTVSVLVRDNPVTHAMSDEACVCDKRESVDNNNMSTVKYNKSAAEVNARDKVVQMKEVVLEQNGNLVVQPAGGGKMSLNDNFIPPIAQV